MTGFCGQSDEIRIARAALHYYEEPCISGKEGSGAVFFTGCNLRCVFCQNISISQGNTGKPVSVKRLAEIFTELEKQGANNINLVTPTHFAPQITEAIKLSRQMGLLIPIVYNTGSYEKPETLRLLKNHIDVYLPDFKYWDDELAAKYSNASNYRQTAIKAIEEMVSYRPLQKYNEKGIMTKGVIVRHMILPGHTKDSMKIIEYLYKTYANTISLSLMNQYTPLEHVKNYPELNRKITKREYDKVIDYALSIGVENAYIQEGNTANDSFIPEFDFSGI